MDIPETLRERFPPSNQGLLDATRRQIDDAMLREIAVADYGIAQDEHLAALRRIRDLGVVPLPLDWHPKEVLTLTRWCDPDDPNRPPFNPGPSGRRGHLIRAFACAALLQAEPEEATLAQCLASTKALDEEISRAAACFLTWQIPRLQQEDTDRWLWAFGLLVLTPRIERLAERALADAATWFLAEESAARRARDGSEPPPGPFGLMNRLWKPLAIEFNANLAMIKESAARRDLEFINAMLQDEL